MIKIFLLSKVAFSQEHKFSDFVLKSVIIVLTKYFQFAILPSNNSKFLKQSEIEPRDS